MKYAAKINYTKKEGLQMKRKLNRFLSLFLVTGIFISMINFLPANAVDTATNERIIMEFCRDNLGTNTAATCGILANIYKESSFNPLITLWHSSMWLQEMKLQGMSEKIRIFYLDWIEYPDLICVRVFLSGADTGKTITKAVLSYIFQHDGTAPKRSVRWDRVRPCRHPLWRYLRQRLNS